MAKFFNTAGPCVADDHYMIDVAERFADNRTNIRTLIEQKRYFILHAPRQTGKTTMMISLAREITAEGNYVALYLNVEAGQAYRNDAEAVNEVIISEFDMSSAHMLLVLVAWICIFVLPMSNLRLS